jgi:alpha-1,3-rhamnosyltransferase
MSKPLVTIAVPSYNHSDYVYECIMSIIKQDYSDIELIVIDDGSTDNSMIIIEDLAKQCRDRFKRYEVRGRANKGVAQTLNESLRWANGKYFTAIASDDAIFENMVSQLVASLESTSQEYSAVFGDALFIDSDSNPLFLDRMSGAISSSEEGVRSFYAYYTSHRDINIQSDEFGSYRTLLAGNYLPAMSCLLRTSSIRKVGGWDKSIRLEDWDLWLKLSKMCRFKYINAPVSYYRLHGLNTVATNKYELYIDSLKLVEKEKNYAFDHALQEEYYRSKIYLHKRLFYLNKKHIKNLIVELFDPLYVKYFILMLIKKFRRESG